MFVLIQRGQSFVDANNYPVQVCKVTLTQVIFRRLDGRTRAASINSFNAEFERIDHNELHMIKAEIEKEKHIASLRKMRRTSIN
ncbi:DUF4222 domain-containing protein [Escherichia coli]|uniref:Bacteriophage protein n=1 Tax=Escherichia coli TaxID=562 RepID=A0A376DG37_ECOLX|nr:DUF4222 domain-containing protein [Escherichia coli]ODQ12547.1 hypothetical protein BGK51_20450 [Shigella sp. FC569]EAB5457842.1 DUF4222 domain-containing protein [Escherichia coli]EEC8029221.1 DUF4222 domain-containing protein [Escherichia coli]EED0592483.1 DUF4222 domain-containing protein [Escherichia coli]EED1583147.1 DUF4222 domain-containing protein [Escherichia coli]